MRKPFVAMWTLVLVFAISGAFAATGSAGIAAAKHHDQSPTVTTALSASSTTVGGSGVHDTATLAGLTGSTFTGDMVTYTVYSSSSDCTAGTNGTAEGSVSVSGNGTVAVSNTFTPTAAGTYYWQAKFNGADGTNGAASSDCSTEALTVTQTTPTVTTSLSSSSTTVGGSGVHDTATLAGLTGSTFTGDMVTYTVYSSSSDCTAGTNGTAEGSVSVSGNGAVAASNTFTPTAAGTYYWQAKFNGADNANAAASSDCSTEALTVTAATTTPTVTTALSASTTSVGGTGVHDVATLAGLTGSTFTGDMVTYTVYPSASDCTAGTNGTAEGSVSVSGNGAVAASNTFTPTAAGTYYWQAKFNGADNANAAASSDCSAEPLTVSATQPRPPHGGHGGGHLICRPIFIWGWHHHHHRRFFICFWIGRHGFGGGNGGGNGGGHGSSGFGSSHGNAGSSGSSGSFGNSGGSNGSSNSNSNNGGSGFGSNRSGGGSGRSFGFGHGGHHRH